MSNNPIAPLTPASFAAVWKPWPSDPRYMVSSDGRVRGVRVSELRAHFDKDGYAVVCIRRDPAVRNAGSVGIHRMMAETFLPNPYDLPLARHLNDVKTDNRVENLAWGTVADNAYDAIRNGRVRDRLAPDGRLVCSVCGQAKPHDDYEIERSRGRRFGRRSACRPCSQAQNTARAKRRYRARRAMQAAGFKGAK